MDETYHGGSVKNKHAKKRKDAPYKDKQPIFGMVERGGSVVAQVVPDAKAKTILPIVKEHVLPDSMVFTDGYPLYAGVEQMGYEHNRINHTQRV